MLNKKANRLIIIDQFLKQNEQVTLKEIKEHIEDIEQNTISERSVQRDLKTLMEDKKAPLKRVNIKGTMFYSYTDKAFVFSQHIEYSQKYEHAYTIHNLLNALEILENIKNLEPEIYDKIVKEKLEKHVIFLEENVDYLGFKPFNILVKCCVMEQVIEVHYHPFEEHIRPILLHPYRLQEFNSRWYVLGYSPELNKIINLPLDRIKHIVFKVDPFIPPHEDSFDFLEDQIGLTYLEEEEIIKIKFKVSSKTENYIKTKALHRTQKVVKDEDLTYTIEVRPNYELEQLLLSFGDNLTVISPQTFKEKLKLRIEMMYKQYQ